MERPVVTTGADTLVVLGRGVRRGLSTYWMLMRIMIPIYVIVSLLNHTPVLPAIARWFEPYMQFWHLPGEAALALVLGHFVNLYAALAVIAAGGWDPVAVTVAGVILGVSHSHLMEGAIFRQMRAPAAILITLRVVVGWSLGWGVAAIISA
jgi:spore maturation protein SpmB